MVQSAVTPTTLVPTPSQSGQQSAPLHIVALTGFMGAGKTSIGRALAGILHWSFVDLDEEIELSQKMPIRDIFGLQSESRFREIETDLLRRTLSEISAPIVIALGGGTFTQKVNAEMLRESGAIVVFLDTPLEKMLERCRAGTPSSAGNLRPLATDIDGFRALYLERLPRYRNADLAVKTVGKTAEENAAEIAARLHCGGMRAESESSVGG